MSNLPFPSPVAFPSPLPLFLPGGYITAKNQFVQQDVGVVAATRDRPSFSHLSPARPPPPPPTQLFPSAAHLLLRRRQSPVMLNPWNLILPSVLVRVSLLSSDIFLPFLPPSILSRLLFFNCYSYFFSLLRFQLFSRDAQHSPQLPPVSRHSFIRLSFKIAITSFKEKKWISK